MPKRVDANQAEIVAALRKVGCSVWDTHEVGHGGPDVQVGRAGVNYDLEIKTPRGKLTDDEADFHLMWRGQICVVRSVEEAYRAVGLYGIVEA